MAGLSRKRSSDNLGDNSPMKKSNCSSIFILEIKIQKKRLELLKKRCAEKSLTISKRISQDVSHIVTDCDTTDEVYRSARFEAVELADTVEMVNTKWLAESIKAGVPLPVTAEHRIPHSATNSTSVKVDQQEVTSPAIAVFPCQRSTPLHHHNHIFTDALEVLEKEANFKKDIQNDARALAFRNASSSLKAIGRRVTGIEEVTGLPDVGRHALQVIQDVLDNGYSTEAEDIKTSDWFQRMKLFNDVYGVGPAIAARWIQMGMSNVQDVLQCPDITNSVSPRMAYGLAFYKDLTTPVVRSEADWWQGLISTEVENLLPNTRVTLVGGFIRGKDEGHDIDLLISHPDPRREEGLLVKLLDRLHSLGVVLFGNHEHNSFHDKVLREDTKTVNLRSTLDHFEKWLGIVKVPKMLKKNDSEAANDLSSPLLDSDNALSQAIRLSQTDRTWMARRVDLVLVPNSQYYYALLGWTGSRLFNRSIRKYCKQKRNMKLTSHGLYDFDRGLSLPASSEEDIFNHLGLTYRPPAERNC